jgi:2-polyprenyl-3-methyl-5-hydroxy-6-metoxy-1,4-benzoquinol methylase
MAWVQDDRLYPKEINEADPFQAAVLKVFVERYDVAIGWLRDRFGDRAERGDLRILDMACGSGYGTEMLSTIGNVVGVDLDEKAVKYAEETYGNDRIEFRSGSADDQAFLESLGTFDVIVSIATIEHIADMEGFLGWMRRAISDAGAAILCFPASLTRDWAAPHHRRDITKRRAAQMFPRAGFAIRHEFYQNEIITIKQLTSEEHAKRELPAPPLYRWILWYLTHPHHLFIRVFELVGKGGFLFAHQEYLLEKI